MFDMGSIKDKLSAFGFEVFEMNGHDLEEIENVFRSAMEPNGKPKAVIAKTVRGYGSPTMTGHDIWFHKAPDAEELDILMKEVEAF